jgi:hypothetical protein
VLLVQQVLLDLRAQLEQKEHSAQQVLLVPKLQQAQQVPMEQQGLKEKLV